MLAVPEKQWRGVCLFINILIGVSIRDLMVLSVVHSLMC